MIYITKTPPLGGKAKSRYSDFIVEEIYEEDGEEKKCEVNHFTINFDQRQFIDIKVPENTEKKEHLIIDLEKINTDTNTATALLSRGLSMSTKRIGYGGLKDKRGVTCQRISIFDPDVRRVEKFGVKGLKVKKPRWGERIELGDLVGNEFTIIIRGIDKSEEEIKKIVEDFFAEAENGLPNYFGSQRFGGKRNITHRVGKLLLFGKFKEAIMLYLTDTFEEEKKELKDARINLARSGDFAKALREFPRDVRPELAMLNHLVKKPADFAGAFGVLPKKTRYLFVHAYQSFIFNRILDKRIELYGTKGLGKIDGDVIENGVVMGLLPGYESSFAEGKAGEVEKEIMKENEIAFENFKVSGMSELSSQGSRKEISIIPKRMKFIKTFDDEFNEGKKAVEISFFLTKGNYATTILAELLKEEVF